MTDSFPRQYARTRRFTLGQPRGVVVGADGSRVAFLRSPSGADPRTALWVYDVGGQERLVAEPLALLDADAEELLSAHERARRERSREFATGIVAFAADADAQVAAFTLSSRLFVADLVAGTARELPVEGPVLDPRPDPTGARIAFVAGGRLHVVGVDGADGRPVTPEPQRDVTWGLAEFIAAEEMDRHRGFWWAPDGERLLVTRVDESPVPTWWIGDPAQPEAEPVGVRYPPPGAANALVTLHVVGLDGAVRDVRWDTQRFPYLARVSWPRSGDPLLAVQSRDQRTVQVLAVDPGTGATTLVREDTDPAWVALHDGVPARLGDGRLVWIADDATCDSTRLVVDGSLVSPAGLQVRAVLSAGDDEVLFTASDDPTQTHVWRWTPDGTEQVTTEPGVHSAATGGTAVVVSSATLGAAPRTQVRVGGDAVHRLVAHVEEPSLAPRVRLLTLGERGLRAGLLLPRDHEPGRPLRVLLDPYGGPGAQRVVAARSAWLVSQWLADQGFAVLVVDGRGTPGRGPAWAREVSGDLATPVLDDQVDALRAAAEAEPDLDQGRVAIRGWSFGGYLAALAVLRRPDVFHAAVAGAPVTNWRRYDTHYTERYLGVDPDGADAAAYDASSLLGDAAALRRPLMLVHGLADDNVVVAHTLELSQRLTENGRPHTVLPLTGVTHMTPQEAVAENLLLLQVEFLDRSLGPR